jgi:hypothetical protein
MIQCGHRRCPGRDSDGTEHAKAHVHAPVLESGKQLFSMHQLTEQLPHDRDVLALSQVSRDAAATEDTSGADLSVAVGPVIQSNGRFPSLVWFDSPVAGEWLSRT